MSIDLKKVFSKTGKLVKALPDIAMDGLDVGKVARKTGRLIKALPSITADQIKKKLKPKPKGSW